MNIELNSLHLHNKYEAVLIDKDGNVKQEAVAYNVVCNSAIGPISSNDNGSSSKWTGMCIGTGTGTPAATDVLMFAKLGNNVTTTELSMLFDYPTSTRILQATFPATTTYVGNITEVGMCSYGNNNPSTNYPLQSHALFVDVEGNSIVIAKTDTDILIVTATLYTTMDVGDLIVSPAAQNNALIAMLNYHYDTYTHTCAAGSLRTACQYIGLVTRLCRSCAAVYVYVVDTTTHAYNVPINDATACLTAIMPSPYIARGVQTQSTRILASNTTRGFFNYLFAGSMPAIGSYNGTLMLANSMLVTMAKPLPNNSVFPNYTLQHTSVGTGDGVQTNFVCPIPTFIINTEEVKVNGAIMTRGIDYTIDNVGNTCCDITAAASTRIFCDCYIESTTALNVRTIYTSSTSGTNIASYSGVAGNQITANAVYTYANVAGYFFSCAAPVIYAGNETTGSIQSSTVVALNFIFDSAFVANYLQIPVIKILSDSSVYQTYFQISGIDIGYVTADDVYHSVYTAESVVYTSADGTVIPSNKTATFASVTSAHWQVRLTCSAIRIGSNIAFTLTANEAYIGYKGQGINFTTPPPVDASITIAATVDRPYKTADYVIDHSYTLTI